VWRVRWRRLILFKPHLQLKISFPVRQCSYEIKLLFQEGKITPRAHGSNGRRSFARIGTLTLCVLHADCRQRRRSLSVRPRHELLAAPSRYIERHSILTIFWHLVSNVRRRRKCEYLSWSKSTFLSPSDGVIGPNNAHFGAPATLGSYHLLYFLFGSCPCPYRQRPYSCPAQWDVSPRCPTARNQSPASGRRPRRWPPRPLPAPPRLPPPAPVTRHRPRRWLPPPLAAIPAAGSRLRRLLLQAAPSGAAVCRRHRVQPRTPPLAAAAVAGRQPRCRRRRRRRPRCRPAPPLPAAGPATGRRPRPWRLSPRLAAAFAAGGTTARSRWRRQPRRVWGRQEGGPSVPSGG